MMSWNEYVFGRTARATPVESSNDGITTTRRKPAGNLQSRDLNGSVIRGYTCDQTPVQARAQIVRMIFLEVVRAAEKLLLLESVPCQDLVTGDAGDDGRGAAAHTSREGISLSIHRWNMGSVVPRRFAVFTATL